MHAAPVYRSLEKISKFAAGGRAACTQEFGLLCRAIQATMAGPSPEMTSAKVEALAFGFYSDDEVGFLFSAPRRREGRR